MLIGIVGKPSSGKTTLLNALCLTDAKMGSYPFTTTDPNKGVAYIRTKCPCADLPVSCNPKTGKCVNGIRYVPIEILDVAGLVPGASEGKGMGNQFLDDLRRADAFIHVVDASGKTDAEGNATISHSPSDDIKWLNLELIYWIYKIAFNSWERLSRSLNAEPNKLIDKLHDQLSGLGATTTDIKTALKRTGLNGVAATSWSEEKKLELCSVLRESIFPMAIAANKIDVPESTNYFSQLVANFPLYKVIPTSGLAELTLRKAYDNDQITYYPGDKEIQIHKDKITNPKFIDILNAIQEKILNVNGSTGVNDLLEYVVYNILHLIVAFPVDDATHLTDKDGNVLPDAILVSKGTTAKQFAGKVHSDLEKHFLHGILVNNNNKRVSASYEVQHGDIIRIVATV